MGPLIVMDVHSRDVIGDMVKKNVAEPTAFDWLAQMRFYSGEGGVRVDDLTDLPYGYEYIGPGPSRRDAADRPLLPHVDVSFAARPRRRARGAGGDGEDGDGQGPGEGAARQTVVMNSDGLDYLAMAKFFKGPRGRVGVLRRVQPHRPRGALRDRAADPDDPAREIGEGGELHLRRHRAAAGADVRRLHHDEPGVRRPLRPPRQPEGALPTVAMMVPDYAMIGEVMPLSMATRRARWRKIADVQAAPSSRRAKTTTTTACAR